MCVSALSFSSTGSSFFSLYYLRYESDRGCIANQEALRVQRPGLDLAGRTALQLCCLLWAEVSLAKPDPRPLIYLLYLPDVLGYELRRHGTFSGQQKLGLSPFSTATHPG